jgi:hypothetical protein
MWAHQILTDFAEYGAQELALVDLSTRGIKAATAIPDALELVKDDLGIGDSDIEQAAGRAAIAKSEIESDFRLLHGHSLVGIWGALETMVVDLVAAWLLNVAGAREIEQIQKIKISIATFEAMEPIDRMLAIVRELDKSQGLGIDRFERLLDPVFLSGSHPVDLAENLYVVQQLRNVFAHRRGVADKRFVTACPFFGLAAGDKVPCGTELWGEAVASVSVYALLIRNRVNGHFGDPLLDATAPPIVDLRTLVEPEAAKPPRQRPGEDPLKPSSKAT